MLLPMISLAISIVCLVMSVILALETVAITRYTGRLREYTRIQNRRTLAFLQGVPAEPAPARPVRPWLLTDWVIRKVKGGRP